MTIKDERTGVTNTAKETLFGTAALREMIILAMGTELESKILQFKWRGEMLPLDRITKVGEVTQDGYFDVYGKSDNAEFNPSDDVRIRFAIESTVENY